jgi:hypothetical protein
MRGRETRREVFERLADKTRMTGLSRQFGDVTYPWGQLTVTQGSVPPRIRRTGPLGRLLTVGADAPVGNLPHEFVHGPVELVCFHG